MILIHCKYIKTYYRLELRIAMNQTILQIILLQEKYSSTILGFKNISSLLFSKQYFTHVNI